METYIYDSETSEVFQLRACLLWGKLSSCICAVWKRLKPHLFWLLRIIVIMWESVNVVNFVWKFYWEWLKINGLSDLKTEADVEQINFKTFLFPECF